MTVAPDQTQIARSLQDDNPGWVIMWRLWARRFWACPCWGPDSPEPLEAKDADDLLHQIRQAETATRHPQATATRPGRHDQPPPPNNARHTLQRRGF
ncbi:hypothetical protein [Streptosporangium sp. KLBMP 9127]|nr:hypothetical protein [Streptosporangium sp. KLBMP 9127]